MGRDRSHERAVGRTRGSGRAGRGRLAALVVGAATVVMAAPAAAAPGGEVRSANAFWTLPDATQTRVSLTGRTGATADEPGSLFLFVTQSFCDQGTDQKVFRSFRSQGPLDAESFRAHPLLKSASLQASATMTGSEQRVEGCTNTTGFPSTFVNLGPSAVTVQSSWQATGDPVPAGPGTVSREATATGSLTGTVLSLGSLGTTTVASLRSQSTT